MKIKYQVSAVSLIEQQVLLDKILSSLRKQDYLIENKTNDSVFFKDDKWQIRSKGTGFRKVDKGVFEIIPINEGSLIRYTYYISFLPELIITSIIVIVSIFQSYLILFIALPFLIQFVVRNYTLRGVSTELVKSLANSL